ncbi:MAG: MoaD/ThiS family protein [Deltaproteobacteria bacterium]|nr:MoaD/ThiS family protein [Deltaproteobacteria bacterium]
MEQLLADLEYRREDLRRVAAAVNGKRNRLSAVLEDGNRVSLVLLAGGG